MGGMFQCDLSPNNALAIHTDEQIYCLDVHSSFILYLIILLFIMYNASLMICLDGQKNVHNDLSFPALERLFLLSYFLSTSAGSKST